MGLTAIIDSSSAILLYKTTLLEKTSGFYELVITVSVRDELVRDGYPGSMLFAELIKGDKITILNSPADPGQYAELDRTGTGERDSLLQLLEGNADFIIIDDRKGAVFCSRNSLPYINALLVPKILFYGKAIGKTEFDNTFRQLVDIGRYSKKIIEFAKESGPHDLWDFIPSGIPV